MTLGSVVCTASGTNSSQAFALINSDNGGLASFGNGTNVANKIYDITDCNKVSFIFTCQAGSVSIKNTVFE